MDNIISQFNTGGITTLYVSIIHFNIINSVTALSSKILILFTSSLDQTKEHVQVSGIIEAFAISMMRGSLPHMKTSEPENHAQQMNSNKQTKQSVQKKTFSQENVAEYRYISLFCIHCKIYIK
jgi:hypothetical protein